MGLPVEDNTCVKICFLLKITREYTYFVGSGFFFQCRLSVERLLNVLISVLDVMGEEECSLRNAWRLYYVPWTPPVREALKDEEAKSTAWSYRGIHSTLRIQQ